MDKKTLDEITGRAITDPEFREGLRNDPEATLRAAGYTVTPEVLNAIKAASKDDLDAVASEYERRFLSRQSIAADDDDTGGGGPMG